MNILLRNGIKNGKLVHINDVSSGLDCNCICPACNEKLIAVKGYKANSPTHHFRHKSLKDCKYVYETALHFLAKEIIEKNTEITLPVRTLKIENIQKIINGHKWYEDIGKVEFKSFTLKGVVLEKKLHSIIPDIIAKINDKSFIIEIAVTSFVKEEKMKKIEEIGLPVLEIDLSDISRSINEKQLENILLNDHKRKKWIYNLREYAINEYLREQTSSIIKLMTDSIHTKQIKKYKGIPKVNNCPKEFEIQNEKRYSMEYDELIRTENIFNRVEVDRCKYCNYLWEINIDEKYIQCIGSRLQQISSEFIQLKKNL